MCKTITLLLLFWSGVSYGAVKKQIPSYIQRCRGNDPNLNKCMRNAFEAVRPYLPKGIPEMRVPAIEPLLVQKAVLDTGNNFKASFTDLEIYEGSKYEVNNVDINLQNNSVHLELLFPFLRLEGDYEVTGRLLFLSLNGNGRAYANISNIHSTINIKGERVMRNGKEHIKFHKNETTVSIEIGPGMFYFENIFRNNPQLTKGTNDIFNDNLNEIMKELQPVLKSTISSITYEIASGVFKTFSYDELFM